uniref:Uncharacterized protein n=1 Tax=Arundo donax TaxID=35708 RepID=A0A0A9HJQ5_ARUDO
MFETPMVGLLGLACSNYGPSFVMTPPFLGLVWNKTYISLPSICFRM